MRRIAIVHDWFTTYAGSEKVVESLLQIYPQAHLFSLLDILPEQERAFLGQRTVTTSFLQHAPWVKKHYRAYLPLMPLAIEQLDLSGYDLVISSCHAVSKGIICAPEQLHISYIHTPMRYAWDLQAAYLQGRGIKNALARIILHYIRLWDSSAAQRPDRLVANSAFVARRIQKFYRRPAEVIFPPVDTDFFTPAGAPQDYYLAVSRLVPYKRLDIILQAFANMPDKRLVVIGTGPEADKINSISAPNITYLGYQPRTVLRDYLRQCRALVFAAKEDFGITPVEAQACGRPVIAFGEGGVVETVRGLDSPQPSGLFFLQQTSEAICAAVNQYEANAQVFQPDVCRSNAERFSIQNFCSTFAAYADAACDEFFGYHSSSED